MRRRRTNSGTEVLGYCVIYAMAVSSGVSFLWMITGLIQMMFNYIATVNQEPLKWLAMVGVGLILVCGIAIVVVFIAWIYVKFQFFLLKSKYVFRDFKIENRLLNGEKIVTERMEQLEQKAFDKQNDFEQYYEYVPSGATDIDDMPVTNYLLEDLRYLECALITGESRSGKTTLIQHLVSQKTEQYGSGLVKIVLDPDNKAGKWGDIDAIGGGGDYRIIENALDKIVEIFEVRSKLFYICDGEDAINPKILIVIDEFHILQTKIEGIWDKLMDIFTRGRKHSMYLYIISNGTTAESIGLKGRMELMHNFEATIKTFRVNQDRRVEVKTSKGIKEYEHCGKYIAGKMKPIDKLVVHSQPTHKAKDDAEKELISSLCKPVVVYDRTKNMQTNTPSGETDIEFKQHELINKESVLKAVTELNGNGLLVTPTAILNHIGARRSLKNVELVKENMP